MTGFSFISLFSITMWIHLNFGDRGLEIFLRRSVDLLDLGRGALLIGMLSLEPIVILVVKSLT
jgi:hypothetical protein